MKEPIMTGDEFQPEKTPSVVLELSDANFDDELCATDQLLLVDFWAAWCGPCQSLAPVIEDLAHQYTGRLRVAKVNADHSPRLGAAFGIRSLPTVLLLKPGPDGGAKVLDHRIGMCPRKQYVSMIEKALNPPPGLFQKLSRLLGGSSPDGSS